MPHIHTDPGQYDHTVTAYIVRVDGDEPRALLHMHKKLGKLMPIGGHVELTETPWESIAHELSEESGYELEDLTILQPRDRVKSLARAVLHPVAVVSNTHNFFDDRPGEHFHSDTAYAFVAETNPTHSVAAGESDDLRWLSQVELARQNSNDLFENNRQIYNHIFDVCLKDWERVNPGEFDL
jgi:ADP-ribose pyrophosphatase YjhB (NUDIX family)